MSMDWIYWHWWLLGLTVILSDLLLGANFALIWTGAALLLTGLVAFFIPATSLEWQLVIFVIFEGAALWLWRYCIVRQATIISDKPQLNNRLQSYIGQIHKLTRDVVDGKSAIRIHDSDWLVNCEMPLRAGEQVRVVRIDGATLVVEKVN